MPGLLWLTWSGRERGQKVASEEPLAFRVVRGALFVAASSYFNILFGFLANLVLTRLLAPEAFGVFSLAMFFLSTPRNKSRLHFHQSALTTELQDK